MNDLEKWFAEQDAILSATKNCVFFGNGGQNCETCKLYNEKDGCAVYAVDCSEIRLLHDRLTKEGIPHEFRPRMGGYQIYYPHGDPFVCSAITNRYSYGWSSGLIEIMGLLTPEEEENDSVLGYLTATDVFERIKAHYEDSKEATP